ncbi:MAG: hypothetical protein Q9162_001353 [Coniocarpon cinnabarinum]
MDSGDPMSMYQAAMQHRMGGAMRRFDEYYRCYPIAMLSGPDRASANHGGKVFLPASALEKLTRLHISYPMLFELINGAVEKMTHAGVLEFTAEEGKIYLPPWIMNTLLLETGDMIQVKSTDLSPGSFIKLQPQSPTFLEISDPKAVLEHAFRNFSALTVDDIFSFEYNDEIYEIKVLEVKPDLGSRAICTMETDLEVDFAEPLGYQEYLKEQQKSKPQMDKKLAGGQVHNTQGTMAQAINYDAIAPKNDQVAKGEKAMASHFAGGGQRLGNRKSSAQSSGTATPLQTTTPNIQKINGGNGPQPLRLPPNKLFFGYEYIPPPGQRDPNQEQTVKSHFSGRGQTTRGKVIEAGSEPAAQPAQDPDEGSGGGGRTLRDSKR